APRPSTNYGYLKHPSSPQISRQIPFSRTVWTHLYCAFFISSTSMKLLLDETI
ncbi:MAG: hypothetical protein ACI96P_001959, partial [Candidatus Azotimanducaceae bacterium]